MRLVIWHGYLLGGTGSNVYTRQLAREWAQAGHDVAVVSQDPDPGAYDLGGATACTADVGPLLPVFVMDTYAGRDVRLLGDCSRPSSTTGWQRTPRRCATCCPRTSFSATTSCSAGRSGLRPEPGTP